MQFIWRHLFAGQLVEVMRVVSCVKNAIFVRVMCFGIFEFCEYVFLGVFGCFLGVFGRFWVFLGVFGCF